MKFVLFTKRTDDPKLSHLEQLLADEGIVSKREGHSVLAPRLVVREDQIDRAWELLQSDVFGDGRVYDEIPDDDPIFGEFDFGDDYEDDSPQGMGWVGSDGLP